MSNDAKTSKRPTHTAYSVREYEKNGMPETTWTGCGVAWAHRDGDGFDLVLEAFPVSGRVVIRKNKPKRERA
jgi:hypothetical protein